VNSDFSAEYSERSDAELLQLASERNSLTAEAADALDAELRRRNLTEFDRVEYQRFVEGQEQPRTISSSSMNRLRRIGNVVLDTLIAVLGTAALESSIPHRVAHSGADIILRAWITSAVIASLLGVLATRYRASKTGVWAWLLPGAMFAFGALLYLSGRRSGFTNQFSGYNCAIGLEKSDCNDFIIFTLPFIRGAAYSTAALLTLRISTRFSRRKPETV